jgi:hypothetical protein
MLGIDLIQKKNEILISIFSIQNQEQFGRRRRRSSSIKSNPKR